ncbi:hypothetical protein FB45DRAFT_1063059 [Roridomyces roridus]|uniref:AB hydrolase-1 domain-containing protein n=1 Tax=Roridomyces roridus TaxID=1738132 RepID=A0AAD7BE87_9AGAR|nr:hypothetical protein FB45DRAFT_1063059 [Roridomyces roridus]
MPTVSIPGKDVQLFYTDSGIPNYQENYKTLILIHGHTFHGAIFQKLLPLAPARSVRIFSINRHEYPGSTPHTPEELNIYASGTDEERTALVKDAGINIALAVDGIIQKYDLSGGSTALVGWSLGNTFLLAAMCAIMDLPLQSRERLRSVVKSFIMWDPPVMPLGMPLPPHSYMPLYDEKLTPAARASTFATWVGSYFAHGDLSTRDLSQLGYHPTSKPGTFDHMPQEEHLSVVDLSVGDKCDTILTQEPFAAILTAQTNQALFDPVIRTAWNEPRVVNLYGAANAGFVYSAIWTLQDRLEVAAEKERVPIEFRCIEGANHFVMWDDPILALDELGRCT